MTVRDERRTGAVRGTLATLAIVVAVVAGLALVNSFFLEPSPGTAGGPGGAPGADDAGPGGTGSGSGTGLGDGDGGGAGSADGGANTTDCRAQIRTLGTVTAVAAGLTALLAILAVVRGRALGKGFMGSAWGAASLALGSITLVLLAALAFTSLGCGPETTGELSGGVGESAGGGSRGAGGSEGTGDTEVPPPPRLPDWGLVLLILAGVAVLALLVYAIVRWRRDKGGGVADEAGTDVHAREHRALRRILDRGDLQSQEAVVAAYRTFLAWADGRGLPRASEDTPMEHAQRVAGRFRFPPDEMRAFVAAYQVARLSGREPNQDEREHALRFTHGLPDGGKAS